MNAFRKLREYCSRKTLRLRSLRRNRSSYLRRPSNRSFRTLSMGLLVVCFLLPNYLMGGCTFDGTTKSNEVGNMHPEWHSGQIVDFSAADKTVTVAVDETDGQHYEFNLTRKGDIFNDWAFATMRSGDEVSLSCIPGSLESGSNIIEAINFEITGHEEEQAEISERIIDSLESDLRK